MLRFHDLRCLVRYRQQLVDHSRAIKQRIRALPREHRLKPAGGLWTRAGLVWLRGLQELPPNARYVLDGHLEDLLYAVGQLARVTTRLRAVCENDDVVLRLLEQPGIGLVTACCLRAEVGRFGRFASGKQLARFCGLSPRNNSSGQHQSAAGLIRAGNPQLRAVLIEAAHRLMRLDPRWRAFRAKPRLAGKPVCLIAAAVANRWVRGLHHELLEGAVLPSAA